MTEESDYRRESEEVYYTTRRFPLIGRADIEFVKARASENQRRRARLCMHPATEDSLHEMIIVHHRDGYFHPLRHRERTQSFYVIEGHITIAVLEEGGRVIDSVDVAANDGRLPFYMRCPPGIWYAFVLHSEWFVVLESAPGPFWQGEREYAPWAPADADTVEAQRYADSLAREVKAFRQA